MHARGKWDAYTDEKSRVRIKRDENYRRLNNSNLLLCIQHTSSREQCMDIPRKKRTVSQRRKGKLRRNSLRLFLFSQGEIKDLSQSWMCDRISFHLRRKTFLTISNVKSRRTTSHIIYIREGNSDHDGIRCACMCVEGSKAYMTKTSPQADVARCCCCSFFICAFYTHPKFFTSSPSAPAEWK